MLVDVPDDERGLSGRLVRDRGYVEGITVVSRYWFGQDGVLTIDTDYETNQGQERCWFLTDDFRVRVSTARMMDGVNLMTYCSEKRFITPKISRAWRPNIPPSTLPNTPPNRRLPLDSL